MIHVPGATPLLPASSRKFPRKCALIVHWARVAGGGLDDRWIRPLCALVVAGVAGRVRLVCASVGVRPQGGADAVSASLRPLSVDGLLLLATVGLLKPSGPRTRRARGAAWTAFLLGITVSLAANVAAAPALEWKPVLVAGRPPVALLLSVELLVHRPVNGVTIGSEGDDPVDGDGPHSADPLPARALMLDARHRDVHQRPRGCCTIG